MPQAEPYLDFAALSIDSNILRGQRYNFHGGILKQLEQFQGSPIQIVQPDVIHSEGVQHLSAEITETLKAARSNLRTLSKYSEDSKISEFGDSHLCEINPNLMAEEKLNKFYKRINGRVITSSRVSISDLMHMYFSTAPPFETANEKKHEFPDTIALLTIESWAVGNDKRTVLVSKDKGWHAFAKNSSYLHVVQDLPDALALFQPHTKVKSLIEMLQTDGLLDRNGELFQGIRNAISERVSEQTPDIEANSLFYFESDDVQIEYLGHKFAQGEDNKPKIRIVLIEDNLVVLSLTALVNTKVMTTFSFSQYDSIDKDYVPLGGSIEERNESFETEVLIHFKGDWKELGNALAPNEIEVEGEMDIVKFGDIAPDYSNDRDEQLRWEWEWEQEQERRRDEAWASKR
ncbi:PIN domain-containing protein [Pseudomonas fluorescens]|uniref:DUF4935 domain-containing protein n=1 Tax=Pseudomonas fluorescens TaxID=294 RepID=A0AAE2U2R9_PSEFL|nr:PIN domain-containing protein [Pseudomonas fluorescens]MBD8269300.1 DUF4935 domain-containing protein [Pseudomonas fluorescens]